MFIALVAILMGVTLSCKEQNEKSATPQSNTAIQEDTVAVVTPAYGDSLFENDYIKLVKISLKPGEELPMPQSPAGAIYALTNVRLIDKKPDGEFVTQMFKGRAYWQKAMTHTVENIAKEKAEYLYVTRKESTIPDNIIDDYIDLEGDQSQVSDTSSKLLLENTAVRVFEVTLVPGTPDIPGNATPKTHGLAKLLYPLSPCKLKIEAGKEGTVEKSYQPGESSWHPAGEQQFQNIGTSEAHFLIFEFKK
jgi:hypothetical protein